MIPTYEKLPPPACEVGYPTSQLREVMGAAQFNALMEWMYGQTMCICQGYTYNYETGLAEEACGGRSHGTVVYPHDIERWFKGLPVID